MSRFVKMHTKICEFYCMYLNKMKLQTKIIIILAKEFWITKTWLNFGNLFTSMSTNLSFSRCYFPDACWGPSLWPVFLQGAASALPRTHRAVVWVLPRPHPSAHLVLCSLAKWPGASCHQRHRRTGDHLYRILFRKIYWWHTLKDTLCHYSELTHLCAFIGFNGKPELSWKLQSHLLTVPIGILLWWTEWGPLPRGEVWRHWGHPDSKLCLLVT